MGVARIYWPMTQAADLPGMPSYHTIRNWYYRGKLPSTRRCERTGVLLIDVADVQRYILARRICGMRVKVDTLQPSGTSVP
jgi:hypothetical protein